MLDVLCCRTELQSEVAMNSIVSSQSQSILLLLGDFKFFDLREVMAVDSVVEIPFRMHGSWGWGRLGSRLSTEEVGNSLLEGIIRNHRTGLKGKTCHRRH